MQVARCRPEQTGRLAGKATPSSRVMISTGHGDRAEPRRSTLAQAVITLVELAPVSRAILSMIVLAFTAAGNGPITNVVGMFDVLLLVKFNN